MEKVINFLGGKKNGSDRTGVFDVPALLRTLTTALLAFGSIAFAAGNYFGTAKEVPARLEVVERKQDRVEEKLEAILANQTAAAADIRELRACVMGRGNK